MTKDTTDPLPFRTASGAFAHPWNKRESQLLLDTYRDRIQIKKVRRYSQSDPGSYFYETKFECPSQHQHRDMVSACLCEAKAEWRIEQEEQS